MSEQQQGDELGRGVGKFYYSFLDLKMGGIIEVNGTAMEIIEIDSHSKKILGGLEKVGNDLGAFDPRLYFE